MNVGCHRVSVSTFVIMLLSLFLSGCGGGESQAAAENQTAGRFAAAAATQVIPEGDLDCPEGGILVETGIDENGNGVLDPSEVDDTHKVCNGEAGKRGVPGQQGSRGEDGLTAMVSLERASEAPTCPAGGVRIDAGLDLDRNGVLETDEISTTRYVCDGGGDEKIKGAWQDPMAVEFSSSGNDAHPVMAMNGAGNAVSAWVSGAFPDAVLKASYFDIDAGRWNVPVSLTLNMVNIHDYDVAIDGEGSAWVVWPEGDEIRAQRYLPDEERWDVSQVLGDGNNPVITANDRGEVVAAWIRDEGSTVRLLTTRYVPGTGSWSSETEVTSGTTLASWGSLALAMNETGDAVLVWEQGTGFRWDIWSAYYNVADSSWSPPVALSENNASESTDGSHVAMDDSGNAIVVWEQDLLESRQVGVDEGGNPIMVWDTVGVRLWARSYDVASGAWRAPHLLEDNAPEASAWLSRLVMNGNGDAAVAWTVDSTANPGSSQAWMATYHFHTGWSAPRPLGQNSWGGVLDINANGDIIVVWNEFDGMRTHIWSDFWQSAAGWEGASRVENESVGHFAEDVGLDDSGSAMVVWQWRDGESGGHIMSSRRLASP